MEKVNWYGAYTLAKREIKRFLRVYHQTIISPIVSALIFLAIFTLAHKSSQSGAESLIGGVQFTNFMGYGLIIMTIAQNAFANSSSSFIMSKVIGYITDILIPPLGAIEIITAFTIGAILRGIMVGIGVSVALLPFIDYTLYHPFLMVFYLLFSCSLLGQFGILTGLIANSFDQNAAIYSYIITPLSFLSGTFYSFKNLPLIFQQVNQLNPFFYIIDGFRYCLTNQGDSNITIGITFLSLANILIFLLLVRLINRGWRLKN
jgi:ABC-2 type transport system permease protein